VRSGCDFVHVLCHETWIVSGSLGVRRRLRFACYIYLMLQHCVIECGILLRLEALR
jgi:hypothetical protein